MPVQLNLIDDEKPAARLPIWSQLPELARRRVLELFAEILVNSVRSTSNCHAESSHESIEAPDDSSAS
ncbi:MAG: hypothetical protein ABI895_17525 [Deltaproteobacteria bacterium]